MGLCDPKAIRNGRSWADLVNQPGFITESMRDLANQRHGSLQGKVIGTVSSPQCGRDNTLSLEHTKE